MVLATVPAAPPTTKNQRATSWPAPISAIVPYLLLSRLSASAFSCVAVGCVDMAVRLSTSTVILAIPIRGAPRPQRPLAAEHELVQNVGDTRVSNRSLSVQPQRGLSRSAHAGRRPRRADASRAPDRRIHRRVPIVHYRP